MGRVRKPFTRPEGKRSARLVVIATEGRDTERIYFEFVAQLFNNPKIHVEVIKRNNNNSSPAEVLNDLDLFAAQYELSGDDELWVVIDRDFQSWTEVTIKSVAQLCHQKKGYNLALSNPCFELWLILHVKDVTSLNTVDLLKLFENKKVSGSKSSKTYSKKMLADLIGGYNESKYDPNVFKEGIKLAIARAKAMDINPRTRWPQQLGTRVYRLVLKIT